ncbi:ABCC4.2 family protein [Megaselia abdita]
MNRTRTRIRKEPNPIMEASFISKLSFWWTIPLFKKGQRRPLEEKDLYETKPSMRSFGLTENFSHLWDEELLEESPSIVRLIFKAYGWNIMIVDLFFSLTETTTRFLEPICFGGLVSYFSEGSDVSENWAFIYAFGVALCSPLAALLFHPYYFYIYEIGTKVRIGLAGLIFRKCLKLSKTFSNEGIEGRAINILSNDIGRFDVALIFAHDVWKGPLEAVLLTIVMYWYIQYSAIIGIGFVLLFVPLQMWVARKMTDYREESSEKTDFRIKLMNEIIRGIKVIKMYAWEKSFAKVIGNVRESEIGKIRKVALVHAGIQCTQMVTPFAVFISLMSFILLGGQLTATVFFTISSCFAILNDSMITFWPQALILLAEAKTSAKRVKDFMLEGILMNSSASEKRSVNPNAILKGITMKHASASWDMTENSGVSDINIDISDTSLTAIVGKVGAGKTSLLNVILGELPLNDGNVVINGKISYASQEPWIFEGTIRDNIMFAEDYDEYRYENVTRACGLEKDFLSLPNGDLTFIGERGISLSGGQKARINLARAVYRKADIYLLDDPLSAVDTAVGIHIYDKCINGFLVDKIRVLVTHQLQYLKKLEHIIVMGDGSIEFKGSFDELHKTGKFEQLDNSQEENDHNFEESINENTKLMTEYSEALTDSYNEFEEEQAVGSVNKSIYKMYFNAFGNRFLLVLMFLIILASRFMLTGIDYFLSRWVNWEEDIPKKSIQKTDEEIQREKYIIAYASALSLALVMILLKNFGFVGMCLKISYRLHDALFKGISHATIYFFNVNSSGRILNRFSRDINVIDMDIPETMLTCISFYVDLLGVLIIVSIANSWLLIPSLILIMFLFILRHFYINTSRSVKRLESISRSPIYSLTNQAFEGLSTVRSCEAENILEQDFHFYQNVNTSAWYMYLSTTRFLAFWVDVVCFLFVAAVVFSFFILDGNDYTSGDVGIAVGYCLTLLGMCQWGLQQTAEIENEMTSVERVCEYIKAPSEPPMESGPGNAPPLFWPENGQIHFQNLSMKYSEISSPVIKDINLTVKSCEKLGIVGRTGAGKSSIIQALFRLAHNDGYIFIDGLDISTLGLHDIRSKISIIPQEPVLFSGTLRYNLDPFGTKSDDDLWRALNDVQLKTYISSYGEGLDFRILDGGSNFSVGQRQLICLARAILRNNRILILDEATANIDSETDMLIQKSIKTKFEKCTVLTIAHRLHTVMDYDRILVIDSGKVAEIGPPHELLKNENGHLRKLVDIMGKSTSESLQQSTLESFLRNVN